MRNRLIQLLADNKGTAGRRFEILAKDDTAEVFIYDAIVDDEAQAEWFGGVAPQSFVKDLRAIKATTINLRINSPGGSVFGARAIEQALRDHPAKVIAHIDGLAASAASFIAMAADEIVIGNGGMFMIHNAWTIEMGNASDLEKTAALLRKIDGTLVDTYAARTGNAKDVVAAWMEAETWFTGQEAVDNGFANSLAQDAEPTAVVNWNISAFLARVARPTAPKPEATDDHRARQQQRMRLLTRIE